MKSILRILCVATLAFVLSGCNPTSKIHLHGVTNISSPGAVSSVLGSNVQDALSKLFSQAGSAVPIVLNVDAENELALNVKAVEAQFTLSDGQKVYATATLTENRNEFTFSEANIYIAQGSYGIVAHYIIFGYVLQLCHVIKWFGDYVESNPDVEVNKSKTKIIPIEVKPDVENKVTVKNETEENKIAKQEEKIIDIPEIESLIGTEANIMYFGTKGKLACGAYCKLDSKYSMKIGKKATIKSLVPNEGKDSNDLPYIATEIEIAE